MVRFTDAVRQVVAVGIPLRNLYVATGDAEDYGLDVADGEIPEHVATRRWAWVETCAGLAEDEDGDIANYSPEGKELERQGWAYQGSGSFRLEVEPSTVPEGDDYVNWRQGWAEHPVPKQVRLDREQAEADAALRAAAKRQRVDHQRRERIQAGTASALDYMDEYAANQLKRMVADIESRLMTGDTTKE